MSLSRKILVFSCFILLFVILPLFYIARSSLTQLSTYAHDVNEQQIKQTYQMYLSGIAEEKAKTHNEVFSKIQTAASLMGSGLTQIYHSSDTIGSQPIQTVPNLEKHPDTGLYYSPEHEPVITIYWGGRDLSEPVIKEINLLGRYFPMLVKAKEKLHESIAAHVITTSGIGCYYTTIAKARSACFDLPPVADFDIRNGEPLTMFSRSDIRSSDARWTRIYKDDVVEDLMMTASAPIYDAQDIFRGITGIDLPVGFIIRDLIKQNEKPGKAEGAILFSFLLNREGNIIAFPREYLSLFGFNIDISTMRNSADIFNYTLKDSENEQVKKLYRLPLNDGNRMMDIVIDGEKYLLAKGVLPSVEWHLICVAKESDLTASIEKTQIALENFLTAIWKDFLGHSTLVLIIIIMLVFATTWAFFAPIRSFIAATRNISKGDFSSNIDLKRDDELGELARSFDLIIRKLKISEQKEKEHAKELEIRIRQRTQDLENSNKELSRIKNSLERTVAKRTRQLKKLNEHLVFTEESERKAISSDLHDSVSQTLAMCISRLKDIREGETGIDACHLKEVQQFLEQSLREIRSLIYQLSPPILDDFDIEIALGFLIEETNKKHHSHFEYINQMEKPQTVDHAIKITIYRAVSELITNVLKHSGTKKGTIKICCSVDEITLLVSDKGVGFHTDSIGNQFFHGFGLNSLTERIQNFGGSVRIESNPSAGTDIHLTVPVRMNKEHKYEQA